MALWIPACKESFWVACCHANQYISRSVLLSHLIDFFCTSALFFSGTSAIHLRRCWGKSVWLEYFVFLYPCHPCLIFSLCPLHGSSYLSCMNVLGSPYPNTHVLTKDLTPFKQSCLWDCLRMWKWHVILQRISALQVNQSDTFQVFLVQSLFQWNWCLFTNYIFKYWSLHQTHMYWIPNQRLLFGYLWIWILLKKIAVLTFIVLRRFISMLNTLRIQALVTILIELGLHTGGKKKLIGPCVRQKNIFLWCSILCW